MRAERKPRLLAYATGGFELLIHPTVRRAVTFTIIECFRTAFPGLAERQGTLIGCLSCSAGGAVIHLSHEDTDRTIARAARRRD